MHAGKRNPHELRFARAPINASFLSADRAAPKGFKIRKRDPHGAGGTETRGGGKGGETGAIPAESRDLRQIIAKITRRAEAAGSSLESDRLELFRFISDARSQLRDINVVNDRLHKAFKYDDWNHALSDC